MLLCRIHFGTVSHSFEFFETLGRFDCNRCRLYFRTSVLVRRTAQNQPKFPYTNPNGSCTQGLPRDLRALALGHGELHGRFGQALPRGQRDEDRASAGILSFSAALENQDKL